MHLTPARRYRPGLRRNPRLPPSDTSLERIIERIRVARNFDLRHYKRPTLRRRIERRMADRKCSSVEAYEQLLDEDPLEYDRLIETILVKVTAFFRDPEIWEELGERYLPQLLAARDGGEELRAWCAGCATGEEAYSLAITLAEAIGPAWERFPIKIFGTDGDPAAVAFARRAVYAEAQVKDLPDALRERYFLRGPDGYRVCNEIRRMVVFGVNNLVSDAPISRLDLILCRNVFIYMDAELQKRVLTRFQYALREEGLLVLGKSELIHFASRIFEPVSIPRRIYRKNGHALPAPLRAITLPPPDRAPAERAASAGLERAALASLDDPLIATDADGLVALWNDAAARLWGRGEAEVLGKRLASLGLAGLSGDLLVDRSASVLDGRAERERVAGAIPMRGGAPLDVGIEVTRLRGEPGLLYVVRDQTAVRRLEEDLRRVNGELQSANQELQATNEEMQSANEELETTNEELQSANEELQTTNEELQSINEELETTNEELQSTNAELDATNRELARRTDEVNRSAFLQRAIIRSLAAAVVVLDPAGRVTMWNLAAERLLGVIEAEALGNDFWSLHVPALGRPLVARLRKSVAAGKPLRAENVAYELPSGGEGTASIAAIPLTAGDEGIDLGTVLLFEDTTRLARLIDRTAAKRPRGER